MAFKDLKKLALVLSGCFSMLLVASAFTASLLFNWNAPRSHPGSTSVENCHPATTDITAQTTQDKASTPVTREIADSIIPALDPEQEDLLNSDAVLGPSEVFGLNEDLEMFGKVAKKTQPPTPVAHDASVGPVNSLTAVTAVTKDRAPASPAPVPVTKLDAPTNTRPNHRADLRRNPSLRLHWDSVRGAADYQVRVWTLQSGNLVVLLDQTTPDTEVHLDPGSAASLSWQVSARDNSGNMGQTSVPLSVQLLTRSAVKNR